MVCWTRLPTSLVLLIASIITSTDAATYDEHLLLRPLPQSSLLGSFNFRSSIPETSFRAQNFQTFPRSLGQILLHSHTDELHLRFSTGRWDSETWGDRPWNGSREGGTGVELWAWMRGDDEAGANARWLTLINSLSGLFCASLNFIDATRSIRPNSIFDHEGYQARDRPSASDVHLLHGMLPNEVVCTENLTPFLKLLPCKGKAGISSLLDGHKLFDASWQSMAIDVRRKCDSAGTSCDIEVEQTVDMVLNLDRAKRSRGDPIPRPLPIEQIDCDQSKFYHQYGDSCMPLPPPSKPAFKVEEIFGRPIHGVCPSSAGDHATAPICVDVSEDQEVSVSTTKPHTESAGSAGERCFTPPENTDFDLTFSSASLTLPPQSPSNPPLLVDRTLSGRGQQSGGLLTTFKNPSPTTSIKLIYLETLPWFMKPHYHTLSAQIRPVLSSSNTSQSTNAASSPSAIDDMYYRPAVDRTRASHMELVLTVPAASTLTLSYDFEKAILRYTEYPPDANRGFDIPPAVVKVLGTAGGNASSAMYLRTTSLLLYLPTPDFSMPYNVIILTSTVIALAFGSIFNVIVRRFVAADEVPANSGLKGRIAERIGQVKRMLGQWRRSGKGKVE